MYTFVSRFSFRHFASVSPDNFLVLKIRERVVQNELHISRESSGTGLILLWSRRISYEATFDGVLVAQERVLALQVRVALQEIFEVDFEHVASELGR